MGLFLELDSASFAAYFQKLEAILDRATTEVTYWGRRQVIWEKQAYDLNQIAWKVDQTIKSEEKWPYLQCVAGKKILLKLRHFYRLTDEQIAKRGFFIQLVVWMGDILSFYYRRSIESKNGVEAILTHYSNSPDCKREQRLEERQAEHRNWLAQHSWRAESHRHRQVRVDPIIAFREMFVDPERAFRDVFGGDVRFDDEGVFNRAGQEAAQPEERYQPPGGRLSLVENPPAQDCVICTDPLNNGSPVVIHEKLNGDQHPLHRDCMWKSMQAAQGRCPVCRVNC